MQIISLITPGEQGFIIKTTARDSIFALGDGDYDITDSMAVTLRTLWGDDVDLSGHMVRVANG